MVLIERCTHNRVFYARLHEPCIGYKRVNPSPRIQGVFVVYEYHYLHGNTERNGHIYNVCWHELK